MFDYNNIQNKYYQDVFDGKLMGGSAPYDFRTGERLNTGYPISVNEITRYFIFIITPTASVYKDIDETLSQARINFVLLIVGITTAIAILTLFLVNLTPF